MSIKLDVGVHQHFVGWCTPAHQDLHVLNAGRQAYNSRSAERPAVFTILYKMIALNYSFVQFAEQGCQNDHPLFCAKQPFCVMSHSTSRQMLFLHLLHLSFS